MSQGTSMSLTMVTHYFANHRGGIEIVAGRLAREFANLGMRVSWLATGAADPSSPDRMICQTLSASNIVERATGLPYPLLFPSAWRHMVKAVATADAVLVHDGIYVTSVAAYLAARWHRKPFLLVQHIGEVPYRNPLLRGMMKVANALVTRPLLRRADQVVFISEVTRRFFADVAFRRHPVVIFNGVDTALFHPPASAAEVTELRRTFRLPADEPVCLFVGRYVEKKGLPLLEMLARSRPDITFAFAGWGPLDPARWSLPNVRTFPGLSGQGLADLYRACTIFVLPSVGEGYPLVLQEALASGLPCICGEETARADPAAASLLTTIPVAADDPASGLAALDRAVTQVMCDSHDDAGRRRAFACAHYDWAQAAQRYRDILAGLTAAPAPDARNPVTP
jgi:glycosyltransferase involved in cell wall biosynthesis